MDVSKIYIYHITSIGNLASIVAAGCLWSDAKRIAGACSTENIGYSHIKQRRMSRRVRVAVGGVLGDYVPFYFCPRSVMLHSIWRGNVAEARCNQEDIVHLRSSVASAIGQGRPWTFTDRHAEPPEANYFTELQHLEKLNWEVIGSNDWGGDARRPFKQAEFLVYDRFDWTAVNGIGVYGDTQLSAVEAILKNARHPLPVKVKRQWYYG